MGMPVCCEFLVIPQLRIEAKITLVINGLVQGRVRRGMSKNRH